MDINDYLNEHENKGLLRVLTCGSVDDGKSTLIGRLLYDSKLIFDDQLSALRKASEKNGTTGAGKIDYALLLDGLKAEREQGITIDVAYRFFTTPRRKFIIADCPGHEQYTRNMATGASTADAAIILIDARHGVLTQTRRHAFITSLLGIRHLIVAVNKMDIFGYDEDVFINIRNQFKEFATGLDIPDIRFIPISALEGANVTRPSRQRMPWYEGESLLSLLETIGTEDDRSNGLFRFPVQYVIRPDLTFRGFAGSVVSGVIRQGDAIVALPSMKESRVKRIVTADRDLPFAFAPQAVVLELEDEIDISSGDMIVRKGQLPAIGNKVEAHIIWMDEAALQEGKNYIVRQAGRNTLGRVLQLAYEVDVNTLEHRETSLLPLNHVGRVVLETNVPLFFDSYRSNHATGSFIMIDPITNATAGAGMIIRRHKDTGSILSELGEKTDAHFITRTERVKRYGHDGCSVLVAGEDTEVARHWAQVLELVLFKRRLHTFSLDSFGRSEASEAADINTAQLSYSLAEAGLICVSLLSQFPPRCHESGLGSLSELLTIHVWVGKAHTCPSRSYFIINPEENPEGRITALADLLADPEIAQYNI